MIARLASDLNIQKTRTNMIKFFVILTLLYVPFIVIEIGNLGATNTILSNITLAFYVISGLGLILNAAVYGLIVEINDGAMKLEVKDINKKKHLNFIISIAIIGFNILLGFIYGMVSSGNIVEALTRAFFIQESFNFLHIIIAILLPLYILNGIAVCFVREKQELDA